MRRNDDNGGPPRFGRLDGTSVCTRCGTPIVWVRTSMHRIPLEKNWEWWTDHRNPCRVAQRLGIDNAGIVRHRFATVRRPSARLVAAAGRAGRQPRPWKAMKERSSRDESVAHVPVTQAAGQTTGRAGAQASAPPSLSEAT